MRYVLLGLTWAATVVIGYGYAQTVVTPNNCGIAGAYNSSPPTLSSGTFGLVQLDSSGRLKIAP